MDAKNRHNLNYIKHLLFENYPRFLECNERWIAAIIEAD